MTTDRNTMGVPELRHYAREEIEGGVVIRYEVRKPGERDWQPVTLFRPTDTHPEARVACILCGERFPARSMSSGICIPCFWGDAA